MVRFFALLIIAISSTGCAIGTDPASLSNPTNEGGFFINDDLVFIERAGATSFEITLKKGRYDAVREDSKGVYYDGPLGGYIQKYKGGAGASDVFQGGIWIPKNGDKKKISPYHYIRKADSAKNVAEVGALVQALIENEQKINEGRIYLKNAIKNEKIASDIYKAFILGKELTL